MTVGKGAARSSVASNARSNAGNTHTAGEMFMAAELAKRDYLVSLTMGNAKAVDLFTERGGRSLCIQVKAIAHKRSVGWPLPRKEKIVDGVIYICVVLNGPDEPPTYYVLPPDEVRDKGKWYGTRAILNLGAARDFKGRWGLIDEALQRSDGAMPARAAAASAGART